ncbi:MAG: hypothetical protein GWN84_21575 [Gammaproteobacteria bacterium]|nr:hypothetical protein [Gammaproteobacteria bacterium]NIR85312.1 hypothetical protein [Gammaproteobacteria bacterium]NIR88428.1 hypothetical protein [Gammaproteobacteria bacterium]NIU06378.1 hypothetical protein [Gammaproteobacteria bacterium]NIV53277.1 hypothetical protein [Gammaproteobacteria bacterium]
MAHLSRAHDAHPRGSGTAYDEILKTIESDIRRSRSPSAARDVRRKKAKAAGLWTPFLGAVGVLSVLYFFFR